MLAIGLMCGTSVDGLDIALVDINGINKKTKVKLIHFEVAEIPKKLKDKIFNSFQNALNSRFLCSLNFEIANFYAESVNNFLKKLKIKNDEISFISTHGQTIYHLIDPNKNENMSTLQLGDISVIANKTRIKTIGDFRTADMSAGGQGAPLVAYPDYLLFSKKNKITLLQNIGGMSNVSVITEKEADVFAFDNGPGNVLIDFIMKKLFNKKYDKNGEEAFKGKLNNDLLKWLMSDPYYSLKPPKSTGREKYSEKFVNEFLKKYKHLNKNDILTTVTYFTAYTIAKSYKDFVFKKGKKYSIYLSGGGANNMFILKSLQTLLPNYEVKSIKEIGWNVDAKEAIEFVILGNQTYHNKTGNLPKVTGASKKVILGKIANV